MARKRGRPRRPALHITRARAARLYHLAMVLSEQPRPREQILARLRIGLRTFYREVELLRRVGVRIRLVRKTYELRSTIAEAEARLPFPDPQLTFAEMRDLSAGPGAAAKRLGQLYEEVLSAATAADAPKRGSRRGASRG